MSGASVNYRIEPSAPLGAEIRRLSTGLLDAAVNDLRQSAAVDATALASVAARLAEVRSLLRLGRSVVDPTARSSVVRAVKAAQRSLRRPPDHVAAFELAAASAAASVTTAALHRLRLALGQPILRPGQLERPAAPIDVGEVVDRLDAAVLAASLWASPVVDGFALLAPGLAREYQRGREALDGLSADRIGGPTHDQAAGFAGRSLDHHHHLRLLRPVWPKMVKLLVHESRTLVGLAERQLQLGLLADELERCEGPQLRRDAGALLGVLAEDRSDLLGETRWLGARIYADEPGALIRRFDAWWSATERGTAGPHVGSERAATR